MNTAPTSRRRSTRRAAAVAALAGVAAVLGTMTPAHADDDTINVDYDVNGTTHIASTNSDVTLGPATMSSHVAADGSFTADMALPGTRTTFNLLGFLPVTADVSFEPVGSTVGMLSRVGRTQVVTSTSNYYVRLSNIKVGSIFPIIVGSQCRTEQPVTIEADTPAGEAFDIAVGGHLAGTYSIGDFQNCGLNTWLINDLIPGSGNTIDLQLTNGRLV
jgi:hypothetical protein